MGISMIEIYIKISIITLQYRLRKCYFFIKKYVNILLLYTLSYKNVIINFLYTVSYVTLYNIFILHIISVVGTSI